MGGKPRQAVSRATPPLPCTLGCLTQTGPPSMRPTLHLQPQGGHCSWTGLPHSPGLPRGGGGVSPTLLYHHWAGCRISAQLMQNEGHAPSEPSRREAGKWFLLPDAPWAPGSLAKSRGCRSCVQSEVNSCPAQPSFSSQGQMNLHPRKHRGSRVSGSLRPCSVQVWVRPGSQRSLSCESP